MSLMQDSVFVIYIFNLSFQSNVVKRFFKKEKFVLSGGFITGHVFLKVGIFGFPNQGRQSLNDHFPVLVLIILWTLFSRKCDGTGD